MGENSRAARSSSCRRAEAQKGKVNVTTEIPKRSNVTIRSNVTLNIMLDQATEIIDTSRWGIEDYGGEFWIIDRSRGQPTEENNWCCVINGISTRGEAEAILRDWNTPKEQAWRMEASRASQCKPFTSWDAVLKKALAAGAKRKGK
jgi:hypothetical protein